MVKFAEKEKTKLSVMVIAKDEEQNIRDCLETVKWADEIVVLVDSQTQDKTAAIAKKYTKKVFFRKLESFGLQYQAALEKTTGEWVLKLDADERVTPELKEEILKKIQTNKFAAYHTFFRPVFLGKEFKKSKVRIQGATRLFRREKGKFTPMRMHERMVVKGAIGVLDNEILHLSYRTIFQTLEKFNYYSSLEAEELYGAGGYTNIFFILLAPVNIFMRRFLIDKNYRNGMHGLICSFLFAHYYFLKHLKIWELAQREK